MTTVRWPGEYAAPGLDGQDRAEPGLVSDDLLRAEVMSPLAGCASTPVDPDEWFPIATAAQSARAEASRALAVCSACPVRAECLELSMRQWPTVGRYGVWGGLVEADRAVAWRGWHSGTPVAALLAAADAAALPVPASAASPDEEQ